MFLIGFLDDLKIKISPSRRLILMVIFLFLCIRFVPIEILNVDIPFLTTLLNNNTFSSLFVLLCFLFIINGANLIDGYNVDVQNVAREVIRKIGYTKSEYNEMFSELDFDVQQLITAYVEGINAYADSMSFNPTKYKPLEYIGTGFEPWEIHHSLAFAVYFVRASRSFLFNWLRNKGDRFYRFINNIVFIFIIFCIFF